MENHIRYKININNTSAIIFLIGFPFYMTQKKLPAMVLCLGEPPVRFLWCWLLFFIHFCCCSSFCCSSFISRLLCHATSTPHWLLRPMKTSIGSELYPGYFWLPLLFHLPRALRFWVEIFYPQGFFTIHTFPDIFHSTYVYQVLRGSKKFFLELCRGFMLILEIQTWPICLFDSQQSTFFIFRRIRF